jgi:hypothetical protein
MSACIDQSTRGSASPAEEIRSYECRRFVTRLEDGASL